MKKVLILRFSSIGDIVLTTPVVRALKTQISNVEVHYATKQQFVGVLEHNPHITRLHALQKNQSLSSFAHTLKQEHFDFVVDLHNNLRTRLIKWRLGVKSAAFPKLNLAKWLYVHFKKPMPVQHIVERYMQAASPLGAVLDNDGLDFFIPAAQRLAITDLPPSFASGFVAFAIGGQHATKRLPANKIIEFALVLNQPIAFLGGPEDKPIAEEVLMALRAHNSSQTYIHGCGVWNLNQSASVLDLATLVLTHDTAMMHIAAALNKKIVAVWGNTSPELGMYPYKATHVNVQNMQLSCRPCSKIGFKACPKKHFKCMQDLHITPQIIDVNQSE